MTDNSKQSWGDGPWQNEPDRLEFEHAGFPCLLSRSPLGSWCGYAAVPPGHPWHGMDMSDVPAEAHGGITYAEACQGDICHVAKPGEPDNVWWIGFDCSHWCDLIPRYSNERWNADGIYRDIDYVTAETKQLAEQARAAVKGE